MRHSAIIAVLCAMASVYEARIVILGFLRGWVSLKYQLFFDQREQPKRYCFTMVYWGVQAILVAVIGIRLARMNGK